MFFDIGAFVDHKFEHFNAGDLTSSTNSSSANILGLVQIKPMIEQKLDCACFIRRYRGIERRHECLIAVGEV